jgi:hypothetical protein
MISRATIATLSRRKSGCSSINALATTSALVMLCLSAIVVLPFVSRLAGQPTSLGRAVAGTSSRPLCGPARYTTFSDVTRDRGGVDRRVDALDLFLQGLAAQDVLGLGQVVHQVEVAQALKLREEPAAQVAVLVGGLPAWVRIASTIRRGRSGKPIPGMEWEAHHQKPRAT